MRKKLIIDAPFNKLDSMLTQQPVLNSALKNENQLSITNSVGKYLNYQDLDVRIDAFGNYYIRKNYDDVQKKSKKVTNRLTNVL